MFNRLWSLCSAELSAKDRSSLWTEGHTCGSDAMLYAAVVDLWGKSWGPRSWYMVKWLGWLRGRPMNLPPICYMCLALFSREIHQESLGHLGCPLLRPPFSKSTTAKLKLSALARTFSIVTRVSQRVTRHRSPLEFISKYMQLWCLSFITMNVPHQNCYVMVYSPMWQTHIPSSQRHGSRCMTSTST